MTLLADAPTGRHFAQFHRDRDSLNESVFAFLEGGLRRGHSVVVIAGAELRDRLSEKPKVLPRADRLEVLDAVALMGDFMADGVPDWSRFLAAMVPILARAQPHGRGVRILVEMGSLLWQDGNTDAAVRVEELWNRLAKVHTFSLYCGYSLDTQCEKSYAGPLEEIGHAHSDIVGTEADERFGVALDRASKEIFGITLSQMAGMTNHDGARRFPSGQRTMLWVKRNLPLSTAQLAERARRYFRESPSPSPSP